MDRQRIREILVATDRFSTDEVDCAVELVDQALTNPAKGEYLVYVLEEPDHSASPIAAYVCYGPTPLAQGVFDLYWIAVDPERQGRGFGRKLLKFVETEVKKKNGRMLLIETSSKATYQPTVRFYIRSGYREISRIKDFYRVQHDKIVFCKHFRT
jgi:ribosomal protein S18 acetylase RimI-like enzyme